MVCVETDLDQVDRLLSLLESENVTAGFHFIPKNLQYSTYLETARRIQSKGHNIGMHGAWDHELLSNKNTSQIEYDLNRSMNVFAEKLQNLPSYFVAPSGICPLEDNVRSHPLLRRILSTHGLLMDSTVAHYKSNSLPQVSEDGFLTLFGRFPSDMNWYAVMDPAERASSMKKTLDEAIKQRGVLRLGLHTQTIDLLLKNIKELIEYAKSKGVLIISPEETYDLFNFRKTQKYVWAGEIARIYYPASTFITTKSIQVLDESKWKFWIYMRTDETYILPSCLSTITLKLTKPTVHPILSDCSGLNISVRKALYDPSTREIMLQVSAGDSSPCTFTLKNLRPLTVYHIDGIGVPLPLFRASREGMLTFTTNCASERKITITPNFPSSFLIIYLPPFLCTALGYVLDRKAKKRGCLIGLVAGVGISIVSVFV
jgi:peptidoglycan/xylan/chitin deacetylase (PgdA/CDA1 family)